ncbi:MAG: ATP-dependent zinc metalloprotease FtsH, partial [Clostridia bacterium]|nr:ATP-dependent zinc metalloprotease FtsH [Clostridia bacterium]
LPKGRTEIRKVHAKKPFKPLAPDVKLEDIAKQTVGFTGADLENLLNEAALLAARRNLKAITMKEIEEATMKVIVGTEKKSTKRTEEDKRITAYHEAGHAIATYFQPGQDPVSHVSIIPRGMAAGFTLSRPEQDKLHLSKKHMQEDLVILLGGRVAEALTQGDICTGASNDIERATDMARGMVTKYGMSDSIGPVNYGGADHEVFLGRDYGSVRNYSEATAAEIDAEVNRIITEAYKRCEEILRAHMDKLVELAEYLIEYEKIDGEDFEKLMKGTLNPPPATNGPSDADSDAASGAPTGAENAPGETFDPANGTDLHPGEPPVPPVE